MESLAHPFSSSSPTLVPCLLSPLFHHWPRYGLFPRFFADFLFSGDPSHVGDPDSCWTFARSMATRDTFHLTERATLAMCCLFATSLMHSSLVLTLPSWWDFYIAPKNICSIAGVCWSDLVKVRLSRTFIKVARRKDPVSHKAAGHASMLLQITVEQVGP